MNKPSSFIFMLDWIPIFELLDTKAEMDELLRAIESLTLGNEPNVTSKKVESALKFIEPKVSANLQKWNEIREKRAESGRLGGLAKATKCQANAKQKVANGKQTGSKTKQNEAVTVTVTVTDTDTDTVTDTNSNLEKKDIHSDECISKEKRFTPPSVDEVRQYVFEKGLNVDPDRFVDFYTSKGWMVGKSRMKDWRAACRNWHNNAGTTNKISRSVSTGNEFLDLARREGYL